MQRRKKSSKNKINAPYYGGKNIKNTKNFTFYVDKKKKQTILVITRGRNPLKQIKTIYEKK